MKFLEDSGLQKKALLVPTRRKELRPFVEGGAGVHDFHFLCQAKSTHLRPGEDLPPDGVVLHLPHVGGQGGLGPLVGVLKVGLVVGVASLPLWHGEADVPFSLPATSTSA